MNKLVSNIGTYGLCGPCSIIQAMSASVSIKWTAPWFPFIWAKKRAPIQNLQYDTWSRRIKNTLTIRFSPLTMYFLLSILTKLLQQATDRKITRWDNSPNTQNKVCNDNKNINFLWCAIFYTATKTQNFPPFIQRWSKISRK